jgi:acetyl-CoA C-acetyltransferase
VPDSPALIAAWARSAVAPRGGALRTLQPHEIAAPLVPALLARAGLAPQAVDALVLGNALGAGGNPARMAALAAGLPDACAALSVDSQCCAGLDAVALAVGLLASGQAEVVIAGGVEAWSRAPIRQTRPVQPGELPLAYERPAFAPDPARDPDLLQCAADYAQEQGVTRAQQDAYALLSHQRALQAQPFLAEEIVAIHGLQHDAYPRPLSLPRAARMPLALPSKSDCGVSTLAISCKADGAALVLLATPQACRRLGLQPRAAWLASASLGRDPAMPILAAQAAAELALQRAGLHSAQQLQALELHDAFAVQALSFCQGLGLAPEAINRRGGGLARGHPIAASAAIALVRLLADLWQDEACGARGLAAVAGAGGIGAAVVVQRL